jgi:hypothetical protein
MKAKDIRLLQYAFQVLYREEAQFDEKLSFCKGTRKMVRKFTKANCNVKNEMVDKSLWALIMQNARESQVCVHQETAQET